jgi:cell wall-associated NlpC family hydrolase
LSWVERYIGIPFSNDGLGFDGCHCWGLVRLVLLNERNVEVPTYGELSAKDLLAVERTISSSAAGDPWIKVSGARKQFDVVVMHARPEESGRVAAHVGIMASAKAMLHVERSTSAVLVDIDHRSVKRRVIGTFRHKALA